MFNLTGILSIGALSLDAVIIGVEPQAQYPQHQDLPLRHAGAIGVDTDGLACRFQGDDLARQRKDRFADRGCE
jgi:hypothetical protein